MATNTATTFLRILKILRENSGIKEKREALTYISSQAKKLESSGAIKEEQYKQVCKLVIEAFTREEGGIQYEALGALNAVVQEFKAHSLHLFESMLQTDNRTRLKVLKLLEVAEDHAISLAANDGQALNFFKDCMSRVQPDLMEWLTPTACTNNLQMLTKVEQRVLSDEQKLEEDIINYSLALLRRLYKLAATFEQNVERFDTLLMDKVVTLAYMGHKRQRGLALKVMQAITTNSSLRIRKDHTELWAQYKANLQSMYCKRMLLLVEALEPDWTTQWNVTIQFLGTDLHRGACLINNLLSVEEKAFKSTDAIIRRQAFLSWKLLIDNFALNHQELATIRRIKLLCIPLNAKNSKTELIALTKLEVWWHLIIKLYKDILEFVTPVITQFLNFCFGPLGDTPLLSAKCDIVASPGKKFFKTKVVAIDALYQLIVPKEETTTFYVPMLEERLPHAISHAVFQKCSKSIIHSTGEALLILGQLTDEEMKNRHHLGKILWSSLMTFIEGSKLEIKDHLYRDMILVISELLNHVDKPMIKDMILNIILPNVIKIVKKGEFTDDVLPELLLKFLSLPIVSDVYKNFIHYVIIHLQRSIGTKCTYPSSVFGFLEKLMENMTLMKDKHKHMTFYADMWSKMAIILTKYIASSMNINEGDVNEHNLQIVKTALSFPFQYIFLESVQQMQDQATVWKALYKEFELKSDSINTLKPNEVLLETADMMRNCLSANKNCFPLILNCLDGLLSTINYEYLLAQAEIPSIMKLIIDVVTASFDNLQSFYYEISLKTLSSMLITIYGHNQQKILSYLTSCKTVIELILKSQLNIPFKEVVNMWETVISIFKGLNKHLNHELILLYQEAIITAMNHINPEIRSVTRSIFEFKDFDNITKCVLDEVEKMANKNASNPKPDSVTKRKKQLGKAKEIHIAGSFLNKKSASTKPISNKPSVKNNKEVFILPEPDSQDYVHIKTDLKFDVNRLTEHQKETLKKKREDIPALYNDLSQSSSQNSQNLQEWFDMKAKYINESDKTNNEKSDSIKQNPINIDTCVKKDEITIVQNELSVIDKTIDSNNSGKLIENFEENIVDIQQKEDLRKETKKDSDMHENIDTSKQIESISHTKFEQNTRLEVEEEINIANAIAIVKKLNFESREEFPEEQTHERQSSPSMLDSIKRRHRNSVTKLTSSVKRDEDAESQKDSSAVNVQKASKIKINQEKPGISGTQIPHDDINIKEDESKKSTKRKHVSDVESDGVAQQRRKRKVILSSKGFNDDDSDKSRDSDNAPSDAPDLDSVNQRVKNEMTRLKIDMVFDCPAVNRRRAKYLDEGDKETTSKKIWVPDYKSVKLKSTEIKSTEGSKRTLKTMEKNVKDTNDTNQGAGSSKRRGRKSIKEEPEKNTDIKEAKRPTDITNKTVKDSGDTNMIVHSLRTVPTSSQAAQDITRAQNEKLDKDNLKCNLNKDIEIVSEIIELSEQNLDEVEEVIENSQVPSVNLKLDKKCTEKQCFIKINKIENVHIIKSSDAIIEKNYVPESMDYGDNNVPDPPCEQPNEANINAEIEDKGNKDNISKNAVLENDNFIIKTTIPEDQKTVEDSSPMVKPASVTNFSSPKSSNKLLSKLKPFTPHGRAAHMLGLVTRQVRVESDNPIVVFEDNLNASKKLKTKDVESETSASKKISTVKETDKICGPSGSRQEKIFNNMGLTDCFTSTYAFTTLKNDGEKLSSKLNKNTSNCVPMESSFDKENERDILHEKDELPMLEWSSANPPSLTASPSNSILKRHRSIVSELDPDSTTPNKRKRVSFADPPVSKEMGYEISATESSHKMNKCSPARSLVQKKDSPLRFKQTKLKFISIDAQDEHDTESALQTEKIIESLTKISEANLEVMDIDEQISSDTTQNDNSVETTAENRIDKPTQEINTTMDLLVSHVEDQRLLPAEVLRNPESIDCTVTGDSETQEDIFDGIDAKDDIASNQANKDKITSIQNSSIDSIKLNVTNDSVLEALPIQENNLEDTVDIQNITELNSTVNSDEVFCGKLPSINIYVIENLAEQDTLPVTDSVFASLPLTQDSRDENQNNAELDPEFLDSTQPICPTLMSCLEPIDTIVEQLTNPHWQQNLSAYFANRNLYTIGDLAQLSEREIHRIPVKGKPKTEFVKKVLQRFESKSSIVSKNEQNLPTHTCVPQIQLSEKTEQVSNVVIEEPNVSATSMLDSIEASASIDNETLSCSTPLAQSVLKVLDNLSIEKSFTENKDKSESTSDICSMDILSEPENSNLSSSIVSTVNEQMSANVPIIHSSPGTFISNDKLVPVATSSACTSTFNMVDVIPSSSGTTNMSDIPSEFSKTHVDLLMTHSSIGVGTDDMYSTESVVNKATKSVECQMTLEDLLDEIDVNLVLENAIRRSSPEAIISQYKVKMGHLLETELVKETIRILGFQNKRELNDALLKMACRSYGINKVLLRLPDIFSTDKQFFDRVLKVYNKKLKIQDCFNAFDNTELKNAICQKFTSSELVEMLSDKLKQEEQEGIKQPMPELSSLNAMLQRLPMDVIISHTVANEEVIPASVVLDIALQNNSSGDIARALKAQSPVRAKRVLDKLWTSDFTAAHIENEDVSKESLHHIFKSVCSKLTSQELLNAYHEVMMSKLVKKDKE